MPTTRPAWQGDSTEKPLPPLLDEFRVALREEISAAQRASSSLAVELVGGRRIGNFGSHFQYVFSVDSPLNAPDDSPAELHFPGETQPIEVTIVSVEGLSVVVALPVDRGDYIPRARLQNDLTFLLRSLIARIEDLAAEPNEAGSRLLGKQPPRGEPQRADLTWLGDGDRPNREQLDAIESGLGRDLTFIWGPPGTGKTKTIGTLSVELMRRERSVLLVSHTNAAVDQSLIHVARNSREEDLAQGRVLRLGEPKDERVSNRRELLVETHVERRSSELVQERARLEEEIPQLNQRVSELQRLLDVIEWLPVAQEAAPQWEPTLRDIESMEASLAELRSRLALLGDELAPLRLLEQAARQASADQTRGEELRQILPGLRERADQTAASLTSASERRREAHALRELVETHGPAVAEARQRLGAIRDELPEREPLLADLDDELDELREELQSARALLGQTEAANVISRRLRGLPSAASQRSKVDEIQAWVERKQGTRKSLAEQLERLHEDARTAQATIDQYGHLPTPTDHARVVAEAESAERNAQTAASRAKEQLVSAEGELAVLAGADDRFKSIHGVAHDELLERLEQLSSLAAPLDAEQRRLDEALRHQTTAIRQSAGWHAARAAALGLVSPGAETPAQLVAQAQDGIEQGIALAHGVQPDELRTEIRATRGRVQTLSARIDEIARQLQAVEELVIAEATVVATTLTRAYKRESVQNRKFDTVVLDEASMAPIPALWVAAARAERNVVLVGDFKQLPPIKHSDHELAEKWLGRDIFRAANVEDAFQSRSLPYCIGLREQYRMHPAISAIANEFIYLGELRDGPNVDRDSAEFLDWYSSPPEFHSPITLVDTGSLNAWVTSVNRGGSASRLNFLSATVCADLADAFLRPGRPAFSPGGNPRILLAAPYRPHVKLLSLLLKEQGLDGEVIAGTAHTFQGAEAPVVIFDLVNDEPHWRVGMFDGRRDEDTWRLLNVALTRAQRRLVLVGDFDWIERQAGKNSALRRLLSYLTERYPRVEASDVVPAGLAARAASADNPEASDRERPVAPQLLVTQNAFYEYLFADLAVAQLRVVIYSPFATLDRVGRLEPHLRAALERGVEVWLVTKPLDERRSDRDAYRRIEEGLRTWGVQVAHKRGMHEKLVIIDDHTLWQGSLNPLSFSSTQELMERRQSPEIVADYVRVLRLAELIGAYAAGETVCPYCDGEVFAAEGRDEPYYWRCATDGCFTRSIGTRMPVEGRVVCKSDGGPLEFRWPGEKPFWRCTLNHRHRQPLVRNHLRLPAMRELIPPRDLKNLDRQFGLDKVEAQQPLL